MSDKSHILVIDDEKNYLLVLQTLLEDEGYTVTAISDPETALAFLAESEVDVVVTDMKMPKVSGREVLQHVKKSWPYIPVLIMTAFGSIESAVEAMKYGAFDYITKPFSNDELLLSIHNATELARAHRQYRLLQEAMEERYSVHQIVGRSRAIRGFAEPIPWTEKSINMFKPFIANADLFSVDLETLQKDGLIEAVYVSPAIRPNLDKDFPQDVDERLVRLASINDIDTSPVDWSACDEKLGLRFSVVPYYLIIIKGGIIPPKYITLES